MTLERTLESIEANINAGDLGKARDRLHGLLSSYPDNLELRKRLGAVYWRLQMPEMAGRYWYLEEAKDLDMTAACRRFEVQFGNDPAYLLFALKFRGEVEAIKDTFAGQLLLDLDKRARRKHSWYEDYRKRGAGKYRQYKYEAGKHKTRDLIIKWGCITAAVLMVLVFLAGLIEGIGSLIGRIR